MKKNTGGFALRRLLLWSLALCAIAPVDARQPKIAPAKTQDAVPVAAPKSPARQDDSVNLIPPKDLLLQHAGERKADALAHFVEGARLEENGEVDKALAAYQRVLAVDPGEVELASRVASLLTRQEDYPRAIDVLKDAIKARPKEAPPYLQLAFIYAKHLKKTDQALKYANLAIEMDPQNIDAYQRLYEIELLSGDPKRAVGTLERATKVRSEDPAFWTRLGRLFASVIFKPDVQPTAEDLQRVNEIFKKAVENAREDPAIFKDAADYFAASQQVHEAIPLYLKVLELQPDDSNAREKLATGFIVTNQRTKAVEMLQEIIKLRPEKYQPYELLAQLIDEDARALRRANQPERAQAEFTKAAGHYEQSLLINPNRVTTYLRLAELLIGPVKQSERAAKILGEARQRFPGVPEFTYLLAIAQREAKQPQRAVITFEEALHEAEATDTEVVNAKFYLEYGSTAEQAGLYDKAADLFRTSISLDPANAAEAYNYLGYMWVEQNMHLEEAADMINRALQLDPDNGAYLDSLGWLLYRQGKFEEALTQLQRAAEHLSHDDPVVFEHIGDTHAKLNRVPQALEFWQKALALSPENKLLAEKIESTKTKMSKGEPLKPNPVK